MSVLSGVRIVEFGGLGPATYATMLLADMGAEVIRIERPNTDPAYDRPFEFEYHRRGRRSIALDLKSDIGFRTALRLVETADVLVEAGRPGSMERLNLGPSDCLDINPRLIYGRLTGWGQDGPLALTAGHDINYIALAGSLHAFGPANQPPIPPLALAGDLAGGSMFLVTGICAALYKRESTGAGEVIDAAIVDGAANLMTFYYGQLASGEWTDRRSSNRVDGAAPFYRAYECADGKYVAIGAIEKKFFEVVSAELGFGMDDFGPREDKTQWQRQTEMLETLFKSRTRDEWAERFNGSDACVTPVMSMAEAPHSPHLKARETFVEHRGHPVPGPAPKFERAKSQLAQESSAPGADTRALMLELGCTEEDILNVLRT